MHLINIFQIVVIDTVEKATYVSLDVANREFPLDTIADFTYTAYVAWNHLEIIL